MSISIKPLEDRIVVQTVEAEQTTASGLVIPDTAKEKPQEGRVVPPGPAALMTRATAFRSTSPRAMSWSSASTAAPRSSTTALTTCCSTPATSSRS